ncbi:MAG: coproporphyrinogen III oxidase, partial [Candidatus Nephrothrix sp. EaCA]
IVNRLSIGIQSFDEKVLHRLNRLHTAAQAEVCVQEAQETGFENISIDLIFSIPHHPLKNVLLDAEKAIALQPQHLSVYSLTVEKDTVFGRWARQGKFQEAEESESALQFENIIQALETAGFEQYEISNFAKPQKHSVHNSNYWNESHYLGIGPGAHSYSGELRQSNVANNAAYIKSIEKEIIPC